LTVYGHLAALLLFEQTGYLEMRAKQVNEKPHEVKTSKLNKIDRIRKWKD
jgi:hypothetical protein